MAHYKYEGDIEGISAEQLAFISSVLEERGYTNEKVIVETVGQDGDNYVANVKRISIDKNGETFKMVAKIAPSSEQLRKTMNTVLMFNNEHLMYTEVLPKFADLQKGADIPENERLRFAACYGSSIEAPHEVILLEDLKVSNFVMLDRFVSLTTDTVKLVLKNFAILHSLSYVLKMLEPETFANYSSKLLDMWSILDRSPETTYYFTHLENDVVQMLDNVQHKDLMKGTLSKLTKSAAKNYKIDKNSKHSVIQQGDSWTNNIMFVLKDNVTVDCCMIDYQVSKESSPANDLHYMIFNCTDHETRLNHYYEWLDYYHTELDKALSNFGLKVNFVYPRDKLDADLKRHGKLAFGQAMLVATVLMRETGEATKFKEALKDIGSENIQESVVADAAKVSNLDEKTVLRFRNRIEGLLKSFVEYGYL